MSDLTCVQPFERDDYPYPGQCVAIINPKSEARARRCGKPSGAHIANYFPVCVTHREYLDEEMFSSSAADLIHMQSKRIEELEREVLKAKGSAAEWRRLAHTKHGALASESYKPVPAKDSFVYFIQSGDYIKIGKADNPATRLKNMRRFGGVLAPKGVDFAELKIVGLERGGRERESELHKKFRRLRTDGEWFEANSKLVDYINGLPQISSPQWGELVLFPAVSEVVFSSLSDSESLNSRGF